MQRLWTHPEIIPEHSILRAGQQRHLVLHREGGVVDDIPHTESIERGGTSEDQPIRPEDLGAALTGPEFRGHAGQLPGGAVSGVRQEAAGVPGAGHEPDQ